MGSLCGAEVKKKPEIKSSSNNNSNIVNNNQSKFM